MSTRRFYSITAREVRFVVFPIPERPASNWDFPLHFNVGVFWCQDGLHFQCQRRCPLPRPVALFGPVAQEHFTCGLATIYWKFRAVKVCIINSRWLPALSSALTVKLSEQASLHECARYTRDTQVRAEKFHLFSGLLEAIISPVCRSYHKQCKKKQIVFMPNAWQKKYINIIIFSFFSRNSR